MDSWAGIALLEPFPRMDIFLAAFDDIPDPWADNARHDLCELLVVGFVAVLCCATSCAEMADFGRAKEHVFRGFLKLRHAIPSHDTFSTVFRMIDPKALDAAVGRVPAQIAAMLGDGDVIAIDGKALHAAARLLHHIDHVAVLARGIKAVDGDRDGSALGRPIDIFQSLNGVFAGPVPFLTAQSRLPDPERCNRQRLRRANSLIGVAASQARSIRSTSSPRRLAISAHSVKNCPWRAINTRSPGDNLLVMAASQAPVPDPGKQQGSAGCGAENLFHIGEQVEVGCAEIKYAMVLHWNIHRLTDCLGDVDGPGTKRWLMPVRMRSSMFRPPSGHSREIMQNEKTFCCDSKNLHINKYVNLSS